LTCWPKVSAIVVFEWPREARTSTSLSRRVSITDALGTQDAGQDPGDEGDEDIEQAS
jgi:hypothetical protein